MKTVLWKTWVPAFAGMTILAGCATTPTSIVKQPTAVRPMLADTGTPTEGAIYNTNTFRPMFEDRRARHIGDILTVSIVEKTAANKSGASTGGCGIGKGYYFSPPVDCDKIHDVIQRIALAGFHGAPD